MRVGVAVAASLGLATGATAAPADLAAAFGSRPAAYGVALSPSATKIAYLAALGPAGAGVVVADTVSGASKVVLAGTAELKPFRCGWKTETRLICDLAGVSIATGQLLGYTRILAVNADGTNPKELGQRSGLRSMGVNQFSGAILNWLPDDPNHVLMEIDVERQSTTNTTIRAAAAGISAQRVDVNTARRVATVEPGNPSVWELGTDAAGAVRFRALIGDGPGGYLRDRVSYFARAKGGRDWLPLGGGQVTGNSSVGFDGFDATGDNLFALRSVGGRKALHALAADGSGRATLLFAHPVVDVDGVLRIGKYRRPVAARYTLDATTYDFFDPALRKLSAALGKALPGRSTIDILDESWDETRKLVFAGSGGDPGRYYLFDTRSRELNELVDQRPQLAGVALGRVTPVRYPARDGVLVPAYLTLPPGAGAKPKLPTIIMPHGGPSARDELGFDWLAQFFATQGYAVIQPNFRGSSGYGEAWYANNGFQSWATAIGDINDGARWAVAEGFADPARMAVFGWSYGGYAALLSAATDPGLYKAVVAVAPVTDLALLKEQARSFTNYAIVAKFVGDGPHVTAGSPAKQAGRITAPVLMFHGNRDVNVGIAQSRTMQSALRSAGKTSELIEFPGLDHQLDSNTARTEMLRKSAAFIAANIGTAR